MAFRSDQGVFALQITQEHYILASQSLHLPRPGCEGNGCEGGGPGVVYGWRKRGLYFFLLLLLVTMIVNLALTVWILKVMNFSMDGMGSLKLNQDGIRVEGKSEFLSPLYVNEIQSRGEGLFVLKSEKNVTLNARNDQGLLTGQLTVGPESVEAQCQRLEVRSSEGGRLLFTAEEEEVVMTTEKFTITGSEGAVFGHSVETPLILAKSTEDLKLESPTRTLTMEAPRGVEVSAAQGFLQISGRKDLQLESTEGEILLDANIIQLGNLPLGTFSKSPPQAAYEQSIYEVCVCPSGKVYLSPAQSSSTCQIMNNICLWS
ncbi:zeta-sarcoglycan-like [Boleophthalmus pectinirostris]|uniref:zeta-sarcoglycan-like n=1 Tax=Boleophthalmus pectinirostris TaxID=150288 RepID=UPI0024328D81|nr:zeta-sarcoglycan-like [Boleophthalmus pectinirostris]